MPRKNGINSLTAHVPTKIKTQELIDDKRKDIIKGALLVFKEKGYHKTTVRDIAKAAKISMGSLYDYISSKEDLLYLFYEVFILTYYQKVVSVTSNIRDPKKKLKVAYKTLLEVGFSLEDEVLFGWTEAKNMKEIHLKEILRLEQDLIKKNREQPKNQDTPQPYEALKNQLAEFFNANISLQRSSNGKGKIVIPFRSDDELERIIGIFDRLKD